MKYVCDGCNTSHEAIGKAQTCEASHQTNALHKEISLISNTLDYCQARLWYDKRMDKMMLLIGNELMTVDGGTEINNFTIWRFLLKKVTDYNEVLTQ